VDCDLVVAVVGIRLAKRVIDDAGFLEVEAADVETNTVAGIAACARADAAAYAHVR